MPKLKGATLKDRNRKSPDKSYTATIPVTENLPHKMYLREQIGGGRAPSGLEIEIARSGPHIIVQLGPFGAPEGRQFHISILDVVTAVLDQLAPQG